MVLDDFDHGILSPSGRVSNRQRKATEAMLRARVSEAIARAEATPRAQPSERQRLMWRLRDVRGWYERGMHPRLFKKEIAQLEARIAELPDCGEKV